jgi:hypothetical protein
MTTTTDTNRLLAGQLVTFLETGEAPDGLFSEDAFVDFTPPQWRLQAQGREAAIASRVASHPYQGKVPRTRFDATERGFLLEVEETWHADGDDWYCRELMRCDVTDGSISEISVYCTGDWDTALVAKHRQTVSLLRP